MLRGEPGQQQHRADARAEQTPDSDCDGCADPTEQREPEDHGSNHHSDHRSLHELRLDHAWFRRSRRTENRVDRCRERPLRQPICGGKVDPHHGLRQRLRQKSLLPRRQRQVGIHAKYELTTKVKWCAVGQQAARVPAITAVAGHRLHRGSEDAAGDGIDRIAHTRAAVVAIIVVPIELVRLECVGGEHLHEPRLLRRREVQLLHRHRAIEPLVCVERLLDGERLHPVARVAGEEPAQEVRLREVEHAPVVDQRPSGRVVPDDQRIVSELLEHLVALPHGEQQHRLRGPVDGALRRRARRHCRHNRHQCDQQHEQRTPPSHESRPPQAHSRISFPSSALR